jgi:Spy/CpxP family protein refolding chaperone
MKKTIGIAVVVTLGLFVGAEVVGRPGFVPGFGPPAFAGGAGPWASAGLTSEQSAKLQAIRQDALKEIAPLQQDLFQKTSDLRNLTASRKPDEAKISALQKEILSIQGQLQKKGTKFRLEAQKVAPEQPDRLSAYGPGPGFAPGRARMGRPW